MSRERKAKKGDYTVGYARPPVEHQFKPGVGGNPSGRPASVKTIERLVFEAAQKKVKLPSDGRRVRKIEIMAANQVNNAARGDFKSTKYVTEQIQRYVDRVNASSSPDHLSPDDQAILRDFFERYASERTKAYTGEDGKAEPGDAKAEDAGEPE